VSLKRFAYSGVAFIVYRRYTIIMSIQPDAFTEDQTSLAGFAAAMAHPARIAIVSMLQNDREACCGEIVNALPLAQATVSQHLKVLVEAGLLSTRRDGHRTLYALQCDRIRNFCQSFQCTLGTRTPEPVS
jgi:DNA-binding transcriptional ArsR family regulator